MTEYAATDVVPNTAEYLCTACGEATEFEVGDDFSTCGSCGDENAGWAPAIEEESGVVRETEDESAE